jgi:hypothetical protein
VAVYPFGFTYAYAEMGGFFPLSARQHSGPGTVVFTAAIVLRAVLLGVLAAQALALPDDTETLGTAAPDSL